MSKKPYKLPFGTVDWRHPSGLNALVLAAIIGGLILADGLLVYFTGGTVFVWPHLMYVPIILGAIFFQISGGVLAALLGGLILGPFMPLDVAMSTPQENFNWVFRLCFFVFVGGINGTMSLWLNNQIDKAQKSAYFDALTGLPNMPALEKLMGEYAKTASADTPKSISLAILYFSNINEIVNTLGYTIAKELNQQIANRLWNNTQTAQSLYRLDPRSFAIVKENIDLHDFIKECKEVTSSLKEPFLLKGIPVSMNMHIGISQQNDFDTDMEAFVQKASIAANHAMRLNKLYSTYSKKYDNISVERLALLGSLHKAIQNSELTLFLQPKVDIKKRCITGAETLMRWQHPEEGLISPDKFIPGAEKSWLVHPLSMFAMKTILVQLKRFEEQKLDLKLAVNLTAHNIQDRELISEFIEMIEDYDIDPKNLEIEITERSLVTDIETASDVLLSLKKLGAQISIDDFGAGYSTIRYVRKLPIDTIKIDQSLICSLMTSDFSLPVVKNILEVAKDLGLKTVAEGVETEELFNKLGELGCDIAQGYYISKPMPENEFKIWLGSSPWGRNIDRTIKPQSA